MSNKITIEMHQLESGMNMVDIFYNGKAIPGLVSVQLAATVNDRGIMLMINAMKLNQDGSCSNLDLTKLLTNIPIEDKVKLSQEGDYILKPDEVIEAVRSGVMTNFLIPLGEDTADLIDQYVSMLRNGENLAMDDKLNPGYLTCAFVREKDLYAQLA
jgi:hypothetical protein